MPQVGVQELKDRTTEILRDIRENRKEYIITYRGRPVAILLPLEVESEAEHTVGDVWADLARLRQEIERSWHSEKGAVELISEQRR